MSYVGLAVFAAISSRTRNNSDEYLAVMRMDRDITKRRQNVGFNCMEYGILFNTPNSEKNFLTGMEDTWKSKPWMKYAKTVIDTHERY